MKILNEPKFKTQTTAWKLNDSIPNQVGFQLVVLRQDGIPILTKVIKDETGCHMLKDVRINQSLGWRKATAEEIALKPE